MDEQLIALNDKVASAAQAWLTDPTDTRTYGRLVAAVRERWAYLQPTLDVLPDDPTTRRRPDQPTPATATPGHSAPGADATAAPTPPPPAEQPDELLDGLADQSPVQPLGAALTGRDPREILARLRDHPTR